MQFIQEITGSKLARGENKFFCAWRVQRTRQRVGRVGRACITRALSPTFNRQPPARPPLFEPLFLSISFDFSPYCWWNIEVDTGNNPLMLKSGSNMHYSRIELSPKFRKNLQHASEKLQFPKTFDHFETSNSWFEDFGTHLGSFPISNCFENTPNVRINLKPFPTQARGSH